MQHRQERGRRHALAPESADAAQAYLDLLASTTPLTAVPAPAAALGAPAGSPVIAPAPPAPGAPAAPTHPAGPGSAIAAPAPAHPAAPGSATAASSAVPGPEDDAARAYLALLGSSRPLDPAAPVPATEPAATARRCHSHRAPARATVPFALLGRRGRSAVMTAALIAGVSVAGLSTATANAHSAAQPSSRTAAHTPLDPSTGTGTLPTDAATAGTSSGTGTGTGTLPAGAIATGTDDLPTEAAGAGSDAASADVATDATTAGRDAGTTALAAAQAEQDANQVSTGGALAATPLQRKTRPRPKVTAAWVNPLPEGAVTSCFGQRWGRLHAGVDLATASGTPIRAAGSGTVVAAGPADGYGNAVLIDHGNGYLTHYGHMSEITTAVGRKVKAGQQIGLEGSTGHSTGPHLHFEVHQGHYKNPIEPTRWMHEHGVDIPGCTDLTEDSED